MSNVSVPMYLSLVYSFNGFVRIVFVISCSLDVFALM